MSNPVTAYQSIVDVGQSTVLQGDANAQTNTNMLQLNPGFLDSRGNRVRTRGTGLGYVRLFNGSGSTGYVGIGVRIPNDLWTAGQWVDATTTFTDDTLAAQDRLATDFPLETLTINDGFLISSDVQFNAVLIDVITASNLAAGDPVRAARYSNAAGTGWAALTTVAHTAATVEYAAATETVIVWDVPLDWGRHVSGLGTNTPLNRYLVNVRATTTPDTTAGVATALSIYRIYFLESIATATAKTVDFTGAEARLPYGDGVVGFFAVASAGNRVTALLRPRST